MASVKTTELPGPGGKKGVSQQPRRAAPAAGRRLGAALLAAAASLAPAVRAGELDRSQGGYYCEEAARPFFASAGGLIYSARPGALPARFARHKPAGTRRIFIAGGTPARLLGRPEPAAGERIEFINCGMPGYDSRRVERVAAEALAYGADLLIVFAGGDEGGPEPCPGAEAEALRGEFRSRERAFAAAGLSPREAAARASLALRRESFARTAAAAKKAGVPVIFATLPVIMKDLPPDVPLPLELPGFAEGFRLFHSGRYREAYEKFLPLLSGQRPDPMACFYAAKSLEKLGNGAGAAGNYARAAALDPDAARPSSAGNAALREAAAAAGACPADLEKLFAGLAPGGLTGFGEMADAVRWRPAMAQGVMDGLSGAAAGCGIEGFAAQDAPPAGGYAEAEAGLRLRYALPRLGGGGFDERALAELGRLRDDSPGLLADAALLPPLLLAYIPEEFPFLGADRDAGRLLPDFLAHLAEAERRAGKGARALALNGRALALAPGSAYTRLGRALILADLGRTEEARAEFLALSSAGGHEAAGEGKAP